MGFNLDLGESQVVRAREKDYPITIEGDGVPILVIGNGIVVQRTLSKHLKKHCKIYATDLYWDRKHALKNPTTLTFNQILEDIVMMKNSLGLDKPVILGFSAFGIVAIELVKKYPNLSSGVVMIGTPVNSNQEVAATNRAIFDLSADKHRKKIHTQRSHLVSNENLTTLPFHERFQREYIYRDAPLYWHNPEFDCSLLWRGIELDSIINHFFTSLISTIDICKNLEQIQVPVFLAAGLSDYDCCPTQGWKNVKNLPPKFKMEVFKKSGHYPHYEESTLFDKRLLEWLKENKLISSTNLNIVD